MSARNAALVAFGLVVAAGAGYVAAHLLGAGGGAPREEPAAGSSAALESGVGQRVEVAVAREDGGGAPAAPGWNRRNNEGVELLGQGDLDLALSMFEECLAAEPENETFRHNLAEALAQRASRTRAAARDDPQALDELARAVDVDPTREDLAALLARWREEAAVEESFWRADGYAFELVYDPQRVEIDYHAPILLSRLELAYDDMRLSFGVDPVADGRPRIRVGLYTREEFERVTGLGHWAGGVYDGTVRVPIEDFASEDPHLDRVLRHELSHHFTREAGGRGVPGWLDEGLAQWNEGRDRERVSRARELLVSKGLIPLERLRGSLAGLGDEGMIHLAYAQALALVDHIHGASWGGEHVLYGMVRACGEGGSPEDAFERLVGFPLEEGFSFLEQEL